jgi:hypothetical protein
MTTEPISEEAFMGRGFAVDDRLWMVDWEVEFSDRRRYEDRFYGEGIVDEIMPEAQAASCRNGATPVGAACAGHYSYSDDCKEVDEKMDIETHQSLNGYVALFDLISERMEDVTVAIAILQEMSKDRRSQQMHEEQETKNSEAATERQKKFMKKLGIKYPENVTKVEASTLIDEELAKNGNSSD